MSTGSFTSDHEIKIDTTTKKFILADGENKSKLYRVLEEVPKYDRDIKIGMGDWKGGHGQLNFTKQPDVYYDGQSIDTTLEGKIILGPAINATVEDDDTAIDGNPVCSFWFSAISKYMMATSKMVYWWDGTKWSMKEDFTAIGDIVDMVEYNGYLFVALGTADPYYYSSDGAAFTASTLTDHHAIKFLVSPNAAGTANVLWKAITPNEISSNTSGINGGAEWASPTYTGDTSNNITNIFLVNDNLMTGRTDNLFNVDTDGGVHPLMDDLKHNRTTKNFEYVVQWQTTTYFSLGTGLGEILSYNTYQPISPLMTDDIGKVGTCVGLTSDRDFLYVAIDEGTNTHIYKGREVRRNGVLRWEWCPYVYLGTNVCSTIRVVQHSATDRRLWFGYGTAFNYVILSDDPLADTSYTFAASGWLRMSYLYGSNPMWDKLYQTIVTETKGCAANITVTPKYRKDTDTSMTALTSAITTNGVVHTNLTAAIACKRIQFELDLATNDSSKTPEVTLFEARGTEKPETIRIHEATYVIGDMPSKKTETLRAFLRGGRTSTTLMCFADLRYGQTTSGTAGTDYIYVVMEPGYPQEVDIIHEKGRAPELGIKCRFIELNLASSAIVASAATLPTGVANTMIYYNGTSWATITASGVMALLSGSAGAAFSMNSQKITGITDPGAAQDAATKNYVDTFAGANALDWDSCWVDAVHSHASDAEGGTLTSTLLDDTAGGTDALTTKAPTSNAFFDHAALFSHPNTTPCRYYLNATMTSISAAIGVVRVELDTLNIDTGSNYTIADGWYGTTAAYTQADGSGCSATNIKKTGAAFPVWAVYCYVKWASNADGTGTTGDGFVTAVPDTNNLTIVKWTGSDFANSYYFLIKKNWYVVPNTGVYIVTANLRFSPTEDQKRYNVNINSNGVTIVLAMQSASGTANMVFAYSSIVSLTAGDLVNIVGSQTSLAGAWTILSGLANTSFGIVRVV